MTEALRQLGNGFVQNKQNDNLRSALAPGDLITRSVLPAASQACLSASSFSYPPKSAICFMHQTPAEKSEMSMLKATPSPACVNAPSADGTTTTTETFGKASRSPSTPSRAARLPWDCPPWEGSSVATTVLPGRFSHFQRAASRSYPQPHLLPHRERRCTRKLSGYGHRRAGLGLREPARAAAGPGCERRALGLQLPRRRQRGKVKGSARKLSGSYYTPPPPS